MIYFDFLDQSHSLINGSTYQEVDGVQSLYLNGAGAHATAPAVDFGGASFTIASWVKLQQSPVDQRLPVFSDWSDSIKFILNANEYGKILFGCYNNIGEYKPWVTSTG